MCGGGGLVQQGPSAAELEQQSLQNTLLKGQISDAAASRAAEAYKQTPEYLNQGLNSTRTTQRAQYDTGKSGAYQKARQNIIDNFTAFGNPGAAAPYLAALENDYNNLQYHEGGNYGYNSSSAPGQVAVTQDNFNEEAFLAANPDVASAIARAPKGDPNYYQSGRDFLDRTGGWGQRTIGGTVTTNTLATPKADTWDDYTKLLTNDYGSGAYLSGQRQERKDTAYNKARNTAYTTLASMGLDQATTDSLMGSLNDQFQNKYNAAGLSANDYSNVFDPQSVLDSVVGTAQTGKRTGYTTQINSLFSGVDPNKDFADTADDQYISDIVGKQYSDASSALERAMKRGALTDSGYASGMSYLGDQNKSALSTAQSLGGAVLNKNRETLGGIKSGAQTAASGYTLGSKFDANDYLNQYNTKKGALSENLGGDIANALAGQNWFDVGDVLTKAGYAQGAQNTAALTDGFGTPNAAAIAANQQKSKDATRGLAGAGVF